MKKINIKPIVISALSAVALGVVTVGTTFALFTDKAETTITAKAGIVDLESEVVITEVASLNATDTGNEVAANGLSATLTNGGTVLVENGTNGAQTLKISKFTPGDSVKFKISVTNKSNVDTKWRIRLARDGSVLGNVLVDDFGGEEAGWQHVEAADENGTVLAEKVITISFPNTDNLITAREEGVDNQYQDLECEFVLYAEQVQGNAVTDNRIVLSSYEKDATHDGGTYLYDPVNRENIFAVHKSQVNAQVLEGVNLRYKVEAGELVTDEFGYVELLDAASCDFKSSLSTAGGQKVYLPYGKISQAALMGNATYDNSNEHLEFNVAAQDNFALYGATKKEGSAFVNATEIDFAGYGYHSGQTHHAMGFTGTATNPLEASLHNINFYSSHNTAETQNLEQHVNSQTMFFFNRANVILDGCKIDGTEFEQDAVTRAIIDLRERANVSMSNCEVKTYAMGTQFPGAGICTQTLVLVNTQTEASNFAMNGGKVVFAKEAQSHVYDLTQFGLQGTASLAELSLVPGYQNKLVSFYLSDLNPILDTTISSYAFNDVSFYDGVNATPLALNASDVSVTAVADYAALVTIA